jgi:TonB family protein
MTIRTIVIVGALIITSQVKAQISTIKSGPDTVKQDDSSKLIFSKVEVMPEFPGGEDALLDHIIKNIKYPDKAKDNGVSGKVYVSFVIDTVGKVTDVKILRGIGGECDEEAIRVIRMMPRWTPGYQNGKSVNVMYNLPIKFSMRDEKK